MAIGEKATVLTISYNVLIQLHVSHYIEMEMQQITNRQVGVLMVIMVLYAHLVCLDINNLEIFNALLVQIQIYMWSLL
jgi:hypothetical protein